MAITETFEEIDEAHGCLPDWYVQIELAISDLEEDGRFESELNDIRAHFDAFADKLLDALEELE